MLGYGYVSEGGNLNLDPTDLKIKNRGSSFAKKQHKYNLELVKEKCEPRF